MKVNWIVAEMCLPFSTFQSPKGRWKSHFSKNWNVGFLPTGEESDLFFLHGFLRHFVFISFLEKGWALFFNKNEYPLPKDVLYQVVVEIHPVILEKIFGVFLCGFFFFTIFKNVFSLFFYYLPFEKGVALHLNKQFTTPTTTTTTTMTTDNGQYVIKKKLTWAFVSGELK